MTTTDSTPGEGTASTEQERIDLDVTGMTCAACAMRIEKKLNRLEGVTATVNYATERARVTYTPGAVTTDDLVRTVESIGYGAHVPVPPTPGSSDPAEVRTSDLRRRLIVAACLGGPGSPSTEPHGGTCSSRRRAWTRSSRSA